MSIYRGSGGWRRMVAAAAVRRAQLYGFGSRALLKE